MYTKIILMNSCFVSSSNWFYLCYFWFYGDLKRCLVSFADGCIQGPTIFLAASERDFWTCYLHPASNDFCCWYTPDFTCIYVTVPSKSNEMGGCNLERKCATASSVPQHIAHFRFRLRPPISLLLLDMVTYYVFRRWIYMYIAFIAVLTKTFTIQ